MMGAKTLVEKSPPEERTYITAILIGFWGTSHEKKEAKEGKRLAP